ncbi:methyltransferase [Aureimonas altamirensis]|uniref:class I SAM-dependent methyltransferase n=1 Tax=Aureimonas altamirensis TaxID=370622 RepID=UPI0020370E0B|nr:methyltransferase [Aureimonas altamirensis]MCM2502501.1 methyltransferase [Aureimonas altamirensis]
MITPYSPDRARRFIEANTAIAIPPHVPELRLHLADDAHALWHSSEEELATMGLPPPFWAFAWAGGQGLARYILDNPAEVAGRRIVDFASGSGLVAIAAAKAGAARVTAVDIDPFAEAAIDLNMRLNGVTVETRLQDTVGARLEADSLLAGDVFYDRSFAEAIIPWFDTLLQQGVDILVGDPGRAYLPRERLRHLATFRVPVTHALEDSEVKRVDIYRYAG